MPRQEEMSWKVVGSNPGAGKGFFSRETSIKVYLWHHLVVEFVHYTYLCVAAQCINSLGRSGPKLNKKTFFEQSLNEQGQELS